MKITVSKTYEVYNSQEAYNLAMEIGRHPELEKWFVTSPKWSYYYALSVIKDRFPEGEKAIATDAKWFYLYARDVLEGRWPEGEK